MYGATSRAFTEPEGWSEGMARLYYVLAQDFLWADPFKNLIFLDNHDLNRFYNTVGNDLDAMKMAMTFLLTTRGIPQVYYGTELLMDGQEHMGHGEIRRDFPGGWAGDSLNAFNQMGRSDAQNEFFNYMQRLLKYRASSAAITKGKLLQFIPEDGLYVYFRQSESQTVMVVLNNSHFAKSLDMSRYTEATKGYLSAKDILTQESIKMGEGIKCEPRSAMILELTR
jgi:glycosidase